MLLAQAGDWLSLPRGVPHAFRVVGHQPARILVVHDNDSFLQLIRDLGQPAGARQLPPATGGPGLEELSRALADHDVTVAGSSLSNEEARAFMAEHGSPSVAQARKLRGQALTPLPMLPRCRRDAEVR